MVAVLYDQTPKHRDNFLKLTKEGFYNGTLFHRVIKNFMIQGGDPKSKNATPQAQLGNGGVDYTLPAEIKPHLYHKKGALSAARLGDNVNPNKESSGCQFYVVQGQKISDEQINRIKQNQHQTNLGMAYRMLLSDPENKKLLERQNELKKQNDTKGMQDFLKEVEPQLKKIAEKLPIQTFSDQQVIDYKTTGGTPHLDGGYTVFGQVIEGLEVIDKIAGVETSKTDRPLSDVKMTISIIE